jgi:hypothetical protein
MAHTIGATVLIAVNFFEDIFIFVSVINCTFILNYYNQIVSLRQTFFAAKTKKYSPKSWPVKIFVPQ